MGSRQVVLVGATALAVVALVVAPVALRGAPEVATPSASPTASVTPIRPTGTQRQAPIQPDLSDAEATHARGGRGW